MRLSSYTAGVLRERPLFWRVLIWFLLMVYKKKKKRSVLPVVPTSLPTASIPREELLQSRKEWWKSWPELNFNHKSKSTQPLLRVLKLKRNCPFLQYLAIFIWCPMSFGRYYNNETSVMEPDASPWTPKPTNKRSITARW